jgi:hypothetical protein
LTQPEDLEGFENLPGLVGIEDFKNGNTNK